jgi:uncharacterized membrane protein
MDTEENVSMRHIAISFVGAVLAALTVSTGAMAQSYYDDQTCRQFADAQIAPLRDQVNSQAIGGTLLGAGLGAAFGAAVGGGRGAGIGAASGAIVGTGVGAANAQNAAGYLQQQYNGYFTHNAWRRGDIHHRNITDRRRVMRKLRAILQRQAMDRHPAIRAAQPATT